MKTRFHALPILSLLAGLAFSSVAPAAWGQDAVAREDAAGAMQRAESLLHDRQYRKAAAEFERASDLLGGDCPDCLLGVARAYSGAGQIDAALQATRMALPQISEPGRRAQVYTQLGSLLAVKGDMEAARIAFEKAVELDATTEPQVRSSMAAALLRRASSAKAAGGNPNSAPEEVEVSAAPGAHRAP